jgi:hypothetical protein
MLRATLTIPADLPMPRAALLGLTIAALLVAGCAPEPVKELVPSPDTIECTMDGARWLVRFTDGEARLLSPDGNRVNLYQIATASGVRYSNGMLELRGQGMDLALFSDGSRRRLEGCKPLMIPQEDPNPWLRMWQPPPPAPLGK